KEDIMERQTQQRQGKSDRWRSAILGLLLLVGAAPQLAQAHVKMPLSGTWMPTESMSSPRAFQTATLLPNGQVLIASGTFSGNSSGDLASAELYNPATGAFTPSGSLSWGREQAAATLLHTGQALVVGGALGQNAL